MLKSGLGATHGRRRRALIRQILIDRRLRNRVGLDQFLGSLQRDRGVSFGRLGAGQLRLSLVHRSLIRILLDDEQEVAGLDLLPLGEGPLLQEALDTRHQIDRIDRLDAPNEGSRGHDALHGRGGHGHRRNARSARRAIRAPGAATKRCADKDDRPENSPAWPPSRPRMSSARLLRSHRLSPITWAASPPQGSHGEQKRRT